MARPSIYEKQVKPRIKFIQPLIDAGFSQKDIALMLGINEDTLYEYKKKYSEFSECFKKDAQVKEVERNYFNRLTGKYKAEKEVYLPNPKKKNKMELARIERYEIPLGEKAYEHYLRINDPNKWNPNTEEETTNIVDQFMKEVESLTRGNSADGEQV